MAEPTDRDIKTVLLGWFETAMRIALPFLIGVSGWTWTSISNLDKRVTIIESADVNGVKRSIDDMKIAVAVMQQQTTTIAVAVEKIDRKLEARGP